MSEFNPEYERDLAELQHSVERCKRQLAAFRKKFPDSVYVASATVGEMQQAVLLGRRVPGPDGTSCYEYDDQLFVLSKKPLLGETDGKEEET